MWPSTFVGTRFLFYPTKLYRFTKIPCRKVVFRPPETSKDETTYMKPDAVLPFPIPWRTFYIPFLSIPRVMSWPLSGLEEVISIRPTRHVAPYIVRTATSQMSGPFSEIFALGQDVMW